jgi:16S rRNA (guanine966-N2)-methyltransferase
MLDRVREALFSTLGDVVEDARALDLYAGTGSLGLEAMSRGARFVRFCERGRGPRQLLERNVAALGLAGRVEVRAADALDPRVWAPPADAPGTDWAELVLLDPPYRFVTGGPERARVLAAVAELFETIVAPGGVLVLHTHPRDLEARELPGREPDRRLYGNSALWYLWK